MPTNNEGAKKMAPKSSDNWMGGPCRGPIDGYTWQETLAERDRQVMEDGKRLQKYYEAREKENEARRLADLRKWQDEEMEWRRQNWGFYTRHNQ